VNIVQQQYRAFAKWQAVFKQIWGTFVADDALKRARIVAVHASCLYMIHQRFLES
jgi:hypothetical protein